MIIVWCIEFRWLMMIVCRGGFVSIRCVMMKVVMRIVMVEIGGLSILLCVFFLGVVEFLELVGECGFFVLVFEVFDCVFYFFDFFVFGVEYDE